MEMLGQRLRVEGLGIGCSGREGRVDGERFDETHVPSGPVLRS